MRLFPDVQRDFGGGGGGFQTDRLRNGFYLRSIDSPTPIREEDFPKIEAEMQKIVEKAEPFERFEKPVGEARGLCADLKQKLKVEAHRRPTTSKQYPSLSFYRQGEFIDLCRGPHIPHAGKIGAFKILTIAGAYWKNDSTRPQLQRLYATAFFSQKDLDAYLTRIEEAKKPRSSRARQTAETVHHQPNGRQRFDPVDAKGGHAVAASSKTSSRTSCMQTRLFARLHAAHRPAGALSHQRAFSLLPRRSVSAHVSPPRRRHARFVPIPAGDGGDR